MKASLEVARALEDRLWGVRLDTAETMVDKSVVPQMGASVQPASTPHLVWNRAQRAGRRGFGDVKIIVSGGFDVERILAVRGGGRARRCLRRWRCIVRRPL